MSIAGYVHGVPGIVRDDVDNTAYGIASVQGGCRAVQYLDALDVGHVDARVAVFTSQTSAVFQYQYVVLVDAVQAHGSAHAVGVGRDIGRQLHQRFFQRRYVGAAYFFGCDYGYGNGAVCHAAVRTGSGHYHLAEVAVTLLQLYKDVFFLSVRGVFFGGEADVGEAQRVLSVGQIVDDKFSFSVGGAIPSDCCLRGYLPLQEARSCRRSPPFRSMRFGHGAGVSGSTVWLPINSWFSFIEKCKINTCLPDPGKALTV